MAGPLADALFWTLVAATTVAHWFILRSTIRGMRTDPVRRRAFWEWTWAVLPALTLAVLFVWTWSVMHPGSISFELPATRFTPGGVAS